MATATASRTFATLRLADRSRATVAASNCHNERIATPVGSAETPKFRGELTRHTTRAGELETKDATRHRIKWYAGLAIFRDQGVARLEGVLP